MISIDMRSSWIYCIYIQLKPVDKGMPNFINGNLYLYAGFLIKIKARCASVSTERLYNSAGFLGPFWVV